MKQNPIVRDKRAITGLSLTQKVSTIYFIILLRKQENTKEKTSNFNLK